jgi:hypothetical protein
MESSAFAVDGRSDLGMVICNPTTPAGVDRIRSPLKARQAAAEIDEGTISREPVWAEMNGQSKIQSATGRLGLIAFWWTADNLGSASEDFLSALAFSVLGFVERRGRCARYWTVALEPLGATCPRAPC